MSDHGNAGSMTQTSSAAPHPEEMSATMELHVGSWLSMKATARATPAGLISVAVLLAAIFVPTALIRRPRSSALREEG